MTDETVFLEEAFRDRVDWKIGSAREANRPENETQWVRLLRKDVLNSPTELTGSRNRNRLVVFRVRGMEPARGAPLDVQ